MNFFTRVKISLGLFIFSIFAIFLSCTGDEDLTPQPTRLVLTSFRGKSFGTSLQVPIIISAELIGKIRGKMCLLMQMTQTDRQQFQIQLKKGSILEENDPDVSEVVFNKYNQCKQQNIPCMVGRLDTKKTEFIVEVEVLTPTSGGLFVAGLYQGDCTADGTFDAENLVTREAIAIGQEFRRISTPEPKQEPSTSEQTDAGTTD